MQERGGHGPVCQGGGQALKVCHPIGQDQAVPAPARRVRDDGGDLGGPDLVRSQFAVDRMEGGAVVSDFLGVEVGWVEIRRPRPATGLSTVAAEVVMAGFSSAG
ncbi:hypothetical protein ACWDA3_54065 [Nonomuraea rubra]